MVLIALVAMGAGIVVGLSANKAIWEGWVIDRLFQIRASMESGHDTAPAPVAVVGLDQTSLESERLSRIPRVLMTPVLAEAGQALLDAGANALGFDFVFAYSADSFVDPSSGEARLSGFDRPFQSFVYRNRGRVFIAHTEIGVPHRSFTAAIGSGGVRSVIVSTDIDGIVRQHEPELPLNESPHLIDALLGASDAEVSETYTAVPNSRLATSLPYMSLIDVLRLKATEEGRKQLEEFSCGQDCFVGRASPV
ncbi:CHASE2 domain-containing protein [Labrenzia sp. DG1229]|uniref:CHASE2 domain-containing protein n=1 Tax=Labrenzia sp. DG1229 TaxID=681847 RepID=UPI000B183144|nr:CHASE2 domain-containing protein [Labrenzia sp. DG1229]